MINKKKVFNDRKKARGQDRFPWEILAESMVHKMVAAIKEYKL